MNTTSKTTGAEKRSHHLARRLENQGLTARVVENSQAVRIDHDGTIVLVWMSGDFEDYYVAWERGGRIETIAGDLQLGDVAQLIRDLVTS